MLLQELTLTNFRNFSAAEFKFNPFLTIIIGENARGKTNLLEAIYFICFGMGFRESREDQLINIGKDRARVEGQFRLGDSSFDFQVQIKKTGDTAEKIYQINRARKNYFTYKNETTSSVLFYPQQIEIITGSPDGRRKYFDKILSFVDREYKKNLINYENALRKRNKILEIYRDENKLREELSFWDDYLEEQATYITNKRSKYVDYLNKNKSVDSREFEVEYLKSEFNKRTLQDSHEAEKRYKRTLVGPQKDDFVFYEKLKDGESKNVQFYASRSEQRLAIFWLKINEIKHLEEVTGKKPILLLDDIFSELDMKNKKLIFTLINKYQTVVTTTEIELLDLYDMPKSIIKL